MAVTAKFQADFSSFQSAVDKAEVQLRSFEQGAGKVESSLNRMANSLSGTKLIQDANLMAAAVDKVGGVSALTERELQRVGAQAQEAAAKMRALGVGVPEHLQKIADATRSVDTANRGWSASLGNINAVLGTFGAAITVGAVVNFGREVLGAGDRIKKMADQVSESTDNIQRLMYIAGQSGTSVEALVSAAQNLQQRLGDDTSGAAGAMKRLGVNADTFNKLGTYDQIATLAEGIRGLHDPTEQASVSSALFGKTWKEILPAIKGGMKEVGDAAPIMSNDVVEALDAIGDAMTRAKQQSIVWGGQVVVAFQAFDRAVLSVRQSLVSQFLPVAEDANNKIRWFDAGLDGLAGAAARAAENTKSLRVDGMEPLPKILAPTGDALAGLNRQLDLNRASMNAATESAKKHADMIRAHQVDALKAANIAAYDNLAAMSKLNQELQHIEKPARDAVFVLGDLAKVGTVAPVTAALVHLSSRALPDLNIKLQDVGRTATESFGHARSAAAGFGDFLSHDLGKVVVGAFQGGGNVGKSIGASVGNELVGGLSKTISQSAGKLLSGFGSFLGPVGSLLGGAIGGLVGKLFDNPEKQINPLRQAFVDAAGGLGQLNERAHDAGITLDHLLDARNPKQYEAAIKDLNAAFQFQDAAMQTLDETAAKYGFTLAELPDKFRQGKLDDQFLQLFKDQQILAAGGFAFDAVIQKQVGSFNDLIHAALDTGATIPEQLKPAIQRLIDMGQATDSAGNALTDIGQLTFAETLDRKFSTLLGTINKLVDAISRGLGGAITSIPSPSPIHVPVILDFPTSGTPEFAATGGIVGDSGVQHFTRGGVVQFRPRGTDTVPAMLTPGEMVLNAGQQKAVGGLLRAGGGGAGGGSSITVSIGSVGVSESEAEFGQKVSAASIAALRARGVRFSRSA